MGRRPLLPTDLRIFARRDLGDLPMLIPADVGISPRTPSPSYAHTTPKCPRRSAPPGPEPVGRCPLRLTHENRRTSAFTSLAIGRHLPDTSAASDQGCPLLSPPAREQPRGVLRLVAESTKERGAEQDAYDRGRRQPQAVSVRPGSPVSRRRRLRPSLWHQSCCRNRRPQQPFSDENWLCRGLMDSL